MSYTVARRGSEASAAASQSGNACAHSVVLPAPRQTTMSPWRPLRRTSDTRSRWLVDGDHRGGDLCARMPSARVCMIDAIDRQLARRVERRHDDAVGIA